MTDINKIIEAREGSDYQRDNYDDFLKKIRFSFNVPAIHIAGTNGKGSTASYIAAIYQKQGYKVGLYTSPALFEVNEMIKINGQNISDKELEDIILDKKKEINKFELSSFEILTFAALTYFKQEKCDICVIECGMGGEVDATNVFNPVLSVITSISLEHTSFLGKSISEIALQKAGIIKDEIPVLLGNIPEEAIDVIANESKEHQSKIFRVSDSHQPTYTNEGYTFSYLTYYDVKIQSQAFYSVCDACLAIDAIEILKDQFPVSMENVFAGLASVKVDCRFDRLSNDSLTIIDGGHNPEALENLAKSLQKAGFSQKIHVLLACFRDKNLLQMLNYIGAATDSITLTTFDHPRAREESDYFLFLNDYKFYQDPIEAYKALKEQYPEDIILITGSLAFAAYMKKRLTNE